MNPLVSVIIPVYKAESFLKTCLNSVINQTYVNLEIILINDGSPDNSTLICEEYAKKDSRIKFVNQPNSGVSQARNAGLVASMGELITFIDADDWIDGDHIFNLVNGIKDVDCVISGYVIESEAASIGIIYPKEIVYSGKALVEIFQTDGFQGFVWNKMFRRSIILNNGISFNKDIHYMEDLLFCVTYFGLCKNFCCVNNASYHYRQHSSSMVGNVYISEAWIKKRFTAIKALNYAKRFCHDRKESQLCDARKQTEYMEIAIKLAKAQVMPGMLKKLTRIMRLGFSRVLRSKLSNRIKLKYIVITLSPIVYLKIMYGLKLFKRGD